MNRRSFIKTSGGAVCMMSCPPLWAYNRISPVRFGVITDLHYADRPPRGSRYYRDSKQKLEESIRVFNQSNLDFIIELGDFKDQDDTPIRSRIIAYLDEIEDVMRQFHRPVYQVLGNHDMDSISKQEFLSHTKNHGTATGKSYYSFTINGLKFIVLDANYNEDGLDYDSGNFDWTYAQIPDNQLKWLDNELSAGDEPVIIFVHQLLDWFSGMPPSVYIKNAKTVVEILEQRHRVLAVFQGHHHDGNYSYRNGIHYYTLKAAVEGSFPDNNSFAIVEIDEALHIHVTYLGNNKLLINDMPYVEQP
jgi:alkaline phosphatase